MLKIKKSNKVKVNQSTNEKKFQSLNNKRKKFKKDLANKENQSSKKKITNNQFRSKNLIKKKIKKNS